MPKVIVVLLVAVGVQVIYSIFNAKDDKERFTFFGDRDLNDYEEGYFDGQASK